MQVPNDPAAVDVLPASPRRERVLTGPLLLFLVAVTAIIGFGLRSKYPTPDLDGAIRLLADGDLDGVERDRVLRLALALAMRSQSLAHRWAGLMAAIALADQSAYATLSQQLGGAPPTQAPPEADRALLHLGEPMLQNVVYALLAEVAGDRARALVHWRQVAVQCQYAPHPFAKDLAATSMRRLG